MDEMFQMIFDRLNLFANGQTYELSKFFQLLPTILIDWQIVCFRESSPTYAILDSFQTVFDNFQAFSAKMFWSCFLFDVFYITKFTSRLQNLNFISRLFEIAIETTDPGAIQGLQEISFSKVLRSTNWAIGGSTALILFFNCDCLINHHLKLWARGKNRSKFCFEEKKIEKFFMIRLEKLGFSTLSDHLFKLIAKNSRDIQQTIFENVR